MSPRQKIKVLVVEDNELIRVLLQLHLTKLSVRAEVWEARDGEEGLHRCRILSPDLVITDLDMPRVSGIELIQSIRSELDRRIREVPIIATTGTNREWHEKARNAGANFVLEKPIYKRELASALMELLGIEE